jgi:peptidoglycan/xylan/chitin deacetylase (PgdA/CDA1 family)
MDTASAWARIHGRYQRTSSRLLFRRPVVMRNRNAIISFTFDDFPRSALHTGGAILRRFNLAGTYYASLGLMGKEAPTGTMFLAEDLGQVLVQGHELGCHTFAHCDSWETNPSLFEASIIQNRHALSALVPGACFETLSYPITPPWPLTKRRVAAHFSCSRGSGQRFNAGSADVDNLFAYFLEQARGKLVEVKSLIERNCRERGWLIFATHDVSDTPTPYGCTPDFFESVVESAVRSGTTIVPVIEGLNALRGLKAQTTMTTGGRS